MDMETRFKALVVEKTPEKQFVREIRERTLSDLTTRDERDRGCD